MESNSIVTTYLRGLSPVLEKLVEKALKENILIMTIKKFVRITSEDMPLTRDDRRLFLGACNFLFRPGMQRIIVVAWPEIK